MDNQTSAQRFSIRNASWLTIGLAVLTVVTFFAVSGSGDGYGYGRGYKAYLGVSDSEPAVGVAIDSADSMPSVAPEYYRGGEVPVTDTREFLKVRYNATMQTRDVPTLTRRVETTVRGYNGRIDQQSSSKRQGYVSFVVPQSSYDAFRTELESLVGARYLSVNISSENLLSQKVSIEEQQKQADARLAEYQAARQNLMTTYTRTERALQAQIDMATSTQKISLSQQLANEHARYAAQLRNIDAKIKSAQEWQQAVQTKDQKLIDSVATVTGTVSIHWISFWEMLQLYLPGYSIPGIFALLTILSFWNDRRRTLRI